MKFLNNLDGPLAITGTLTVSGTISASNLQDSGVITSGIINAAANFTFTTQKIRKWGPLCAAEFAVTSANAMTVPVDGNVGNVAAGTLVAAYAPSVYTSIMSNNSGAMSQWYINPAGTLTISNVAPGSTIAAGTVFSLAGVWMCSTF